MRIAINATSLNDRPSGARQRFLGIYGALFHANPDVEYLIYEPADCRIAHWFSNLTNVRGVATSLPSSDRWRRFGGGLGYWRSRLRQDRLDLFEALHLPLVKAPDCPTLLTVHDARMVLPDVPILRRLAYRQVLRRSLREADAVVTVSNTMAAELLRIEPAARITTIYNGIAMPSATTAGSPSLAATDYLLAVGHFEPRKNYPALLAAMADLRGAYPDLRLVIVGKDGGTLSDARTLIDQLGLRSVVTLRTDVDDDELFLLYRRAQMLLFPSTYEGFGIPLLEGMAAGCPLAVSDLPVFRELSEGRACYFDPHSPSAIAQAVAELVASPPRQDAQRAYGRQRIADFAFPTLAAQLGALHCQLVAK